MLSQIADAVVNNNSAVGSDLTLLDNELSKVLTALGDVGARASRVDSSKDRVEAEQLDFTSRISENEDVDLPATIMNLQASQVAYQSALGAAAKVMQVSLIDFLR